MNVKEDLFKPIKSQRTFEEVSDKIKELIFSKALKPGDQLPSEQELAKQMGVGRQTVREALRVLELSGFIAMKKGYGGGPVVRDNISEKITGLLLDAFRMKKISLDKFREARLTIEHAIMRDAMINADDKDIEALKKNVETAKKLVAEKEIATDVNFEFHALLAKASKNEVYVILEGALNAIHRNMQSQRKPDLKISRTGVREHEQLLDAIVKKKKGVATKVLNRHICDLP